MKDEVICRIDDKQAWSAYILCLDCNKQPIGRLMSLDVYDDFLIGNQVRVNEQDQLQTDEEGRVITDAVSVSYVMMSDVPKESAALFEQMYPDYFSELKNHPLVIW